MLIIFPALAFLAIYRLVFSLKSAAGQKSDYYVICAEAALLAGLCWLAVLVLGTEGLSLFRAIRPLPLATFWLAVAGLVFWLGSRFTAGKTERGRLVLTPFELTLSGLTLSVVLITLANALIAPPNNYDSMTYHLSRVAHWLQNQSVAHYPTYVLRQLAMTPGAEYFILHCQVLLGSDLLANLFQWICMIYSLMLAMLIARLLGAKRKAQIMAAFIGATLPMGIAQATSTQTDYAIGFFLLAFVYYLFKMCKEEKILFSDILGAALSIGLGMLVKLNIVIIILPFCLCLAWVLLRKQGKSAGWTLLLFILIVGPLNAGYFLRNYDLFHNLTGPTYNTICEKVTFPGAAANMLKSFSQHFSSPFPGLNAGIARAVTTALKLAGVEINDPQTTSYGNYNIDPYSPHEDVLGNPLHLLLGIMFLLWFIWTKQYGKNHLMSCYLGASLASALLFFLVFKFQIGTIRYVFPYFLLSAPLLGIYIEEAFDNKAKWAILILIMLFALPPLLMNITRPFVPPPTARRSKFSVLNTPRQYFYFAGMPNTYKTYQTIARVVKDNHCADIGVINLYYEYPLWIALQDAGLKFRLEHLETDNESARIPLAFYPSAVVAFGPDRSMTAKYQRIAKQKIILGRTDRDETVILFILRPKGAAK